MHAAHAKVELALPAGKTRAVCKLDPLAVPAARNLEMLRAVLLQFTLSGAILNRNSIELAKGIVEVLLWSAEHARDAAAASSAVECEVANEWICPCCSSPVPANFDLCWNCEHEKK
ncbi:MAG: hypothetical protein HY290_27180 [Planctomycetia bacterium]|nr:hypothetical protein [Planctomycetia bacterium]